MREGGKQGSSTWTNKGTTGGREVGLGRTREQQEGRRCFVVAAPGGRCGGAREARERAEREVGLGRTWRKKEILLRSTSYAMNGVHSSGVKTVQMSCHQPMYMSKPKEATLATDQQASIACLFTPLYVMKSVSGVR